MNIEHRRTSEQVEELKAQAQNIYTTHSISKRGVHRRLLEEGVNVSWWRIQEYLQKCPNRLISSSARSIEGSTEPTSALIDRIHRLEDGDDEIFFGHDIQASIGWTGIGDADNLLPTEQQYLTTFIETFERNTDWRAGVGIMQPPQSIKAEMSREERLRHVAQGLEGREKLISLLPDRVIVRVGNRKLAFDVDKVGIPSTAPVRCDVLIADSGTDGTTYLPIGHIDFDLPSQDILYIGEIQTDELTLADTIRLRLPKGPGHDRALKQVEQRISNLKSALRNKTRMGRSISNENTDIHPGSEVHELMVLGIMELLREYGITSPAHEVFIPRSTETVYGNDDYTLRTIFIHSISRAMNNHKNDWKASELFRSIPERSFDVSLAEILENKNQHPEAHTILTYLLMRIPQKREQKAFAMAQMTLREALYPLTTLTIDFESAFYPYDQAFADIEPHQETKIGRFLRSDDLNKLEISKLIRIEK